jgi:hypothetical protein
MLTSLVDPFMGRFAASAMWRKPVGVGTVMEVVLVWVAVLVMVFVSVSTMVS